MRAAEELEPALKEVLYRTLEEIQTTKAALYLLDEGRFRLATQYGFRGNQLRESWDANGLPPDILTTKRAPFFINGLATDQRFSEMLYDADTTRLLLAPIYSKGKLVAFLDMRDKARQAPFSEQDLQQITPIIEAFIALFAKHGIYGQVATTAEERREPEITRLHEPSRQKSSGVVEAAQAALSRGVLRQKVAVSGPSDDQVSAAALVLPAVVSMPGVVLAAITPVSRLASVRAVASRGAVSDAALDHLTSRIYGWLRKRGEPEPVAARIELLQPFGAVGVPLEPARMQSVLSAPVQTERGTLVLTAVFDHNPDASARAALERFLSQVQQLAELSGRAGDAGDLRERSARFLLEPDFERYPVLVDHCRRVSDLSERLATQIGLSAAQVETVRLAGFVHDVGMRLLDYERLYRKPHLTTDEVLYLKMHPVVGAAVIADSPLGAEIANIVLHHHERPDGTGYPDRLAGDAIPIGSRIIAICEAFDAMTAEDSYQPAVAPAAAVGKIRRAAGEQFDADLAVRFAQMMHVENG